MSASACAGAPEPPLHFFIQQGDFKFFRKARVRVPARLSRPWHRGRQGTAMRGQPLGVLLVRLRLPEQFAGQERLGTPSEMST